MKNLQKISDDFALLANAITQKLAWIGTSGGGKTYGATAFAESLWNQGGQFIVIDPVGVWYGLRLEKGGKKPSHINIPVFGGLHGDVPLEATSGALIADLIIDKGICAIIDVSQFEFDTDKARFATAFAARFFFRKKAAPSAVHVFLEECQEFVPQVPQRGEERMLHEFTRMQKIGRNFGIGMSLITQRPQEVSKRVLNLSSTLFAFRTTGAHEREAIERWMKDNRVKEENFLDTLPSLETGSPHVWSPEWLKISKVVKILPKKTFDASATPEIGAKSVVRHLAPIDLEKIKTEMAATIEKAKQEDPKLLRAEIVRLTAELGKQKPMTDEQLQKISRPIAERVAKEEIERHLVAFRTVEQGYKNLLENWKNYDAGIMDIVNNMTIALRERMKHRPSKNPGVSYKPTPIVAPVAQPVVSKKAEADARKDSTAQVVDAGYGAVALKAGARTVLHNLVLRHPTLLSKQQIGTLSGFKPSGGTFGSYISNLRVAGLIVEKDGMFGVTQAGLAFPLDAETPKSAEERRTMWRDRLKEGARKMFDVIVDEYPNYITKEELGERLTMIPTGGTFGSYISNMKTAGIIEVTSEGLRAHDDVML